MEQVMRTNSVLAQGATGAHCQVTIEDAAAADRTFDMLMGSAVPPRKRFIQTHAKQVRNLDV
jgi:DNA gyrase/topoisomerase IV subunit B